jgi:hypothetical protein
MHNHIYKLNYLQKFICKIGTISKTHSCDFSQPILNFQVNNSCMLRTDKGKTKENILTFIPLALMMLMQ